MWFLRPDLQYAGHFFVNIVKIGLLCIKDANNQDQKVKI